MKKILLILGALIAGVTLLRAQDDVASFFIPGLGQMICDEPGIGS